MIGALIAAASGLAAQGATYTIRNEPLEMGEVGLIGQRRRSSTTKHGKHAPRRHGAKLKPNRRIISKRVRRKHRRAA